MAHGSCAVGNVRYEQRTIGRIADAAGTLPGIDLPLGQHAFTEFSAPHGHDMNWKALDFEQITTRELYLILRARSAVFVVEQSSVHLDPDGRDETSLHVFAVDDMSRSMPVIAYARLHEGTADAPEIVVDRMLTSPHRRTDGTAQALIERVLATVAQRWPGRDVRLLAPVGLRTFYEAFGFRKTEGPFLERGVRVIGMARKGRSKVGAPGFDRRFSSVL
jgi:ElaA protein